MGFLIGGISSSYLQSMLGTVLQSAGFASNAVKSPSSTGSSPVANTPESHHSSSFAVLLDTLQKLQQSDPTQYSQVTGQIASNLTDAAKAAQSSGNTSAAHALSQLASDFSSASQNTQLPNIQDLAKAVHFHSHHSQSPSSAAESSLSPSSNGGNQALSQMIAAFQADASQNESLNPMSIILNTLSNAGIGGSNG